MHPSEAEVLSVKASDIIGFPLDVWRFEEEQRAGIKFCFPSWPEGTSPIFSIRPSGLIRVVVSMNFGRSSGQCIRDLNRQSNPESFAFAQTILEQLNAKFPDDPPLSSEFIQTLKFNGETELRFQLRDAESSSPNDDAIEQILKPLIACIACLLEEERPEFQEGDIEGAESTYFLTKKERSQRNRMLAMMIHGETCGVCGLDPVKIFGDELGHFLEVHHIEPLAELDRARAYDPRTDLIPLCPNCHRMIHKKVPAFKPVELKAQLKI